MKVFLFFCKRFGEIRIHFSNPAGTLESFFWVFFRDTDPEPRAGKKSPPQAKPLPRLDSGRNSVHGGGLGSGFDVFKSGFEAKMASEGRPGVPGPQCSPERAWPRPRLVLLGDTRGLVWLPHKSDDARGRFAESLQALVSTHTRPWIASRAAGDQKP